MTGEGYVYAGGLGKHSEVRGRKMARRRFSFRGLIIVCLSLFGMCSPSLRERLLKEETVNKKELIDNTKTGFEDFTDSVLCNLHVSYVKQYRELCSQTRVLKSRTLGIPAHVLQKWEEHMTEVDDHLLNSGLELERRKIKVDIQN